MANENIDKVKTRLAALLTKAKDAGASEAEVAACMVKAQKIMEQFGVTEADLKNMTEADFRIAMMGMPEGKTNYDVIDRKLGAALATFCDCKAYVNSVTNTINYAGTASDVELLLWMRQSFRDFLDMNWEVYKKWELKNASTRRTLTEAKIAFIQGYCDLIVHRLREQKKSYVRATGTDLVVAKASAVDEYLAKQGVRLGGTVSLNGGAYSAHDAKYVGAAAGKAAAIGGAAVSAPRIAIGRV